MRSVRSLQSKIQIEFRSTEHELSGPQIELPGQFSLFIGGCKIEDELRLRGSDVAGDLSGDSNGSSVMRMKGDKQEVVVCIACSIAPVAGLARIQDCTSHKLGLGTSPSASPAAARTQPRRPRRVARRNRELSVAGMWTNGEETERLKFIRGFAFLP